MAIFKTEKEIDLVLYTCQKKVNENEWKKKSIILKVLGFGFKAVWFILKCVVRYVIYFITYLGYACMP